METNFSDTKIYTEFSGLHKLKLAAKYQSPEALEEVAHQFEAFFLKMMLKQMRDASLGDGIFDSQQSRMYQDMMDHQLALNLADKKTVGIANSIIRQLAHTVKQKSSDAIQHSDKGREEIFNNVQLQRTHNIKNKFTSPSEFINELRPHAEQAANQLGIPAHVLLAQSALETGWGKKIISNKDGQSSFNLFGIKADERWQGPSVRVSSLEYVDGIPKQEFSNFRVYQSFSQSFNDYVDFIKSQHRYDEAVKSNNGHEYIKSLQKAGYATDPEYADKVINIIQRGEI